MAQVDRRFLAGVALAVVLLGWWVSGLEWRALGAALGSVSWGWVAAACASLLAEHVFRALRWRSLLHRIDPDVRLARLWTALVLGATANTLLPLRGGDLIRPVLVARERQLNVTAVLSTTVVERVFDIFGVVCTLLAMLLLLPVGVADQSEVVGSLQAWGLGFGAFALGCLALFAVLATQEKPARATFARIVSIAPAPVGAFFLRLFDGFVQGVGATRSAALLARALGWTLCLWTNGVVAIVCTLWAFGVSLPLAASCFVQVAIALSVALPQAPGFLGVFQVVIEEVMRLWGVEGGSAQGIALVFWAESYLPVTTLGLVLAAREGVSLARLRASVPDLSP